MKVLRFNDDATGLLVQRDDDEPLVLDVGASLPLLACKDPVGAALLEQALGSGSWAALIEDWDAARSPLEAMLDDVRRSADTSLIVHRLSDVRLRPPLPWPAARLFATGINFRTHTSGAGIDPVAEKEAGLHPIGFFVIPGTISSAGESVSRPAGVQKLDYEAEVVVILRSGGMRLNGAELRIWGVTGFNDLSIRDKIFGLDLDYDRGPLSIAIAKTFQGANCLGPWVAVDELDAGSVRFGCRVNGEIRQEGSTTDMAYSFGEIAEYLSRWIELKPGDMLTSGTPGGTAAESGADGPFLRDGDLIEVFVEQVGVLANQIVPTEERRRA